MKTTALQVIESEQYEAEYEMKATRAIIEHPKHGRILLAQGFGGLDDICGGAIRWRHGIAVQLQPGDTLHSLRSCEWNDTTSLYLAVVQGYDASRPILEWSGKKITSQARIAGLAD